MVEANVILRCKNCWDSPCSLTEDTIKHELENPSNCARCKQKGIISKLELIRI